ncbi:MAG TPA: NmrA family NAD(P)-binding protein [Intrasporangium sp.]|nr:NmrA family NAD(P)-binding protein [Intrasporangium sp.]
MNTSPQLVAQSTPVVSPVAVIGATGKTGRRVAAGLEARGTAVQRLSRTSATPFLWEDEGTWEVALEASSAAYVTFHPDLAVPGSADVAAALAKRGRDLGVVRCAWFMQNFSEGLHRDAVPSGTVSLPGPGSAAEPFVDADDIAAMAVAALSEPGHEGVVHELTDPSAISLDEAAATLSEAIGKHVAYQQASVGQFADQLGRLGVPRDDGIWLGELFQGLLDGRNAHPTDAVERVLGRPATTFEAWADRAAAQGAWDR